MRIAIISDIHGNLTAFEAVLKDLRETAPDLVLHGGDLAHSGARPAEVVDRIRTLNWQGVLGNTDEMLYQPEALTAFANQTPGFQPLFPTIQKMAAWTAMELGPGRLAWLQSLPRQQVVHSTADSIALLHASPTSLWHAPLPDAADDAFQATYADLGQPIVVYAHIHQSFVRKTAGMTVANTGSVSLSQDGDHRSAYLLVDGSGLSIRRVEYDVDKEITALGASDLPNAEWVGRSLANGRIQPL